MDSETSDQTAAPADGFVNPDGRARTFALMHPVIVNGRTYSEVRLARLTVAQVSSFFETLKDAPKGAAWPVYQDDSGAPLPQAVLDALDDDDGYAIEKAAADFLPRRLSDLMARDGGPRDGEATGNI